MTSTWGDYVIAEQIGRGGFGAVYKAWHPTLRQHIALKLIAVPPGNEREIERALDEPRRLASVRHPNVVTVHDARYADGHVGICMELIAGESLAQIVQRRGVLGPEEVASYAVTLCKALSAIHRMKIVHNDVKAQNVMRQDGGRIVLMDFGAGRHLVDADRSTGLHLVGTPVYMAPELFKFRDATFASDVYSLGVLMFYLLTGQFPVEGATVQEIARAHASGNARRYLGDLRDDVPERLLAIIERTLAPSPRDRYQTSGELLHTLTSSTDVLPRPRHRQPRPGDEASGHRPRKKRAAPDPVAWLRRFVWTDVAMMAAAIPAVWLIGFLSSRAHAVMFGLRGDFDSPAPLEWLVVGFRALPLPIASVMVVAALYVFLMYGWRMMTRVSTRVRTWSSALSGNATTGGAVDLTDPGVLAPLVLAAQVVGLGLVYLAFHDLIAAVTTPLDEALIPAHASLSQDGGDDVLFCMLSSALAFGSAVGWLAVLRRRRPQDGWAAIVAGAALTILFVAMATVPWKTIYESEFRVVFLEDQRCYVVGTTDADALLLCPWRAEGRRVVVQQTELEDQQGQVNEKIFSAIAARLRAEGGE